jgi:hypothetical protein
VYWQTFCGAVHAPFTHWFGATQAGPVPHAVPVGVPESIGVDVVPASSVVPVWPPGAKQSPDWQVSPFGHCELTEHVAVQPAVVQTVPLAHWSVEVQDGCDGAETFEHPYASQE